MAAASATRNLRRWAACAGAQFGGVGERRHFFVLFYETTYFPQRRGRPSAIGCAVNPVTGKKEVMLVSEGQELAMGQQSDPRTDSRKWPS